MAYRNKTQIFSAMRDNFNSNNEFKDIELGETQSIGPMNQYMINKNNIVANIKRINMELNKLYNERCNAVFNNKKNYESLINDLFNENTKLFNGAIELVEVLNKEKLPAYRNLRIIFINDIDELKTQFYRNRHEYEDNMKKRYKKTLDHGAEDPEKKKLNELQDQLYVQGFTDDQIAEVLTNKKEILERDNELQKSLESLYELHCVMTRFANMVTEQDQLFDQIDVNLVTSDGHIENGNKDLEQAEPYQGWWKYLFCSIWGRYILCALLLLGVIGLVVILIVIVILKIYLK